MCTALSNTLTFKTLCNSRVFKVCTYVLRTYIVQKIRVWRSFFACIFEDPWLIPGWHLALSVWFIDKVLAKNKTKFATNSILLLKLSRFTVLVFCYQDWALFWTTVRKKCSIVIKNFEAEGRELAKFFRSIEQFVQTEQFLVTECFYDFFSAGLSYLTN